MANWERRPWQSHKWPMSSVKCCNQCIFGVGNATAMLIGETLGRGNKDVAFHNGKRAVKLVWILNGVMTLLMIVLSKPVASIYNFSGETNRLLIITLITMAITITPKMIGYIYVVGILRAGGDTLFCMKLEIFCNMFIMVPLAYISVLVFHLSLPLTMLLIEVGDLVRTFVCMPRFKSRKWINIVTEVEEKDRS